jgi:hypothetical protein
MAKLGSKILDEHPSAARETRITFYLDNSFNGWVMAYAMLVFPFAAMWGVVKYACSGFSRPEKPEGEDTTMVFLFALSSFAANPLCGTIFAAEWSVFAFGRVVLGGQGALMAALSEFIRIEAALTRPSKNRHLAAAFP